MASMEDKLSLYVQHMPFVKIVVCTAKYDDMLPISSQPVTWNGTHLMVIREPCSDISGLADIGDGVIVGIVAEQDVVARFIDTEFCETLAGSLFFGLGLQKGSDMSDRDTVSHTEHILQRAERNSIFQQGQLHVNTFTRHNS